MDFTSVLWEMEIPFNAGFIFIRIQLQTRFAFMIYAASNPNQLKIKAVPLHATEALGGREDIPPTHSRPRH
jgi:hypothetical protein